MEDIFDSPDVVIVDDLYNHYTLGYKSEEGMVHVFCEWCDEVVCELEDSTVENKEDMDLYELILNEHPEL